MPSKKTPVPFIPNGGISCPHHSKSEARLDGKTNRRDELPLVRGPAGAGPSVRYFQIDEFMSAAKKFIDLEVAADRAAFARRKVKKSGTFVRPHV